MLPWSSFNVISINLRLSSLRIAFTKLILRNSSSELYIKDNKYCSSAHKSASDFCDINVLFGFILFWFNYFFNINPIRVLIDPATLEKEIRVDPVNIFKLWLMVRSNI